MGTLRNNVGGPSGMHVRSTGPRCGGYNHLGFISRYVEEVDTGGRENTECKAT